jgi:hypothetical protein
MIKRRAFKLKGHFVECDAFKASSGIFHARFNIYTGDSANRERVHGQEFPGADFDTEEEAIDDASDAAASWIMERTEFVDALRILADDPDAEISEPVGERLCTRALAISKTRPADGGTDSLHLAGFEITPEGRLWLAFTDRPKS